MVKPISTVLTEQELKILELLLVQPYISARTAEEALGKNTTIASLSFGAVRKFLFKHKLSRQTIPVILENGSLLVMKDETQTHWLHRLPPTKLVSKPRINLTFRTIV